MNALLLEAKQLKKTFHQRQGIFAQDKQVVTALDSVNFSLYAGEAVGLVGESGSGKTTLARILVGLIKQDSGVVVANTKRKIQYIFQIP